MQIDSVQISSNSTTKSGSDCHIVSKFFIQNFSFLVIAIDSSTANDQQFTSDIILDNISSSIVGHFECDGLRYAIVKTQNASETVDPSLIKILTGRELQVAALVALGWPNKKIGSQLQISEWTVAAHLRRIFIKLKVDSRSAMVYRCASLINRLNELRNIKDQMLSINQAGDIDNTVTNKQTLQYDLTEIDRLLCSILETSHMMPE